MQYTFLDNLEGLNNCIGGDRLDILYLSGSSGCNRCTAFAGDVLAESLSCMKRPSIFN